MNKYLGKIPYIHLQIQLKCKHDGKMPKHKTSMIRGIIGRILKKHVCHDVQLECKQCEFNSSCAYSLLFESPKQLVDKLNIGGTVPHPYVIRCHDERTFFYSENILAFEMILIGKYAHIFVLHLLHVFQEIWEYPFGRDRTTFQLHRVQQLIGNKKKSILDQAYIYRPELTYFHYEQKDYHQLFIQGLTPLRMVRDGKELRYFSLELFLWQVKHRAHQLLILNSILPKDENIFHSLPSLDEESVLIVQEEWKEILRYSSRQKRKMVLGGIKTSIELQRTNELDEWLPLLMFGELFHVGKATTFGMGQYELWFKS